MCQGTALEGREWRCVKYKGKIFDEYPSFTGTLDGYELALAVVEDKAVFHGDDLYLKDGGAGIFWQVKSLMKTLDPNEWTWQKPEPKRTFLLNDIELPCPLENHKKSSHFITLMGCHVYFSTYEDYTKVSYAFLSLLDLARDKE